MTDRPAMITRGARFFVDEDGKLMYEHVIDQSNVIGPREATDDDKLKYADALDAMVTAAKNRAQGAKADAEQAQKDVSAVEKGVAQVKADLEKKKADDKKKAQAPADKPHAEKPKAKDDDEADDDKLKATAKTAPSRR